MTEHPQANDSDLGGARVELATFRAQVDTIFRVNRGGAHIPLLLAEVSDIASTPGFERFSLLFHGPAGEPVEQGSYVFDQAALGSLTLFIVPILGSNNERIVYEASFTRPVRQPSAG